MHMDLKGMKQQEDVKNSKNELLSLYCTADITTGM